MIHIHETQARFMISRYLYVRYSFIFAHMDPSFQLKWCFGFEGRAMRVRKQASARVEPACSAGPCQGPVPSCSSQDWASSGA